MPHGNRLTDMEFDEISLVTRPANQLSKVVLYKSGDMDMPEAEDEVFDLDDTLDKVATKRMTMTSRKPTASLTRMKPSCA